MKELLKNKAILAGVFMMAFYQIIMMSVFMWGYSAVPKNMTELTVAIVNEDQQSGTELAAQLKEQLPFHMVTNLSLNDAKAELENRDVHLIVHIPQDFTSKLSAQGEQANLDFLINQANATIVTSSMQSVVNQITEQFKSQMQSKSFEQILQGQQIPEEQAKQTVDTIMNKVVSNVIMTNPVPNGMHNQMAPMFLSMAGYVGAMIYSMMSINALNAVKVKIGKPKAFMALQGLNVLFSLVVPLIGVSIYFAFHGYGAEAFFKTWLIHALEIFASIEFTSLFCLLAGQAGMLLNMPLVLIQSIANGAAIPQEMMPGFFKFMSHISPMYYSAHLDFIVLFGGGGTPKLLVGLTIIAIGSLAINAVVHALKPSRIQNEQTMMMM